MLFIMLWSFAYSQQYTHYTTKEGLPSNHIYRITQDFEGFIWLITDKGIVKYNGTEFKTFSTKEGLPTNDIWDIRITPDNKVWYFSKANQLGYIENNHVYSFRSNQESAVFFPIIINENHNNIQISNIINTYTLVENQWNNTKEFNHEEMITPIFHDKVHHIKSSALNDSIYVFGHDNQKLNSFAKTEIYNKYDYRGQVNDSLFCFINNRVYSIINLNTLKENIYTYRLTNTDIQNRIARFQSVNNEIQITGSNFVGVLGTNYKLKESISISKKLNSHFSFIDKNKNIWIATFNNGVYFLSNVKRNIKEQLVGNNVNKLQFVNSELIASVQNIGFYKYDTLTKSFNPFIFKDDFIYNALYIDSLKTAYYITNSNILQYNKNGEKEYRFNNSMNPIEFARDLTYFKGFLYGFTSYGMLKIEPQSLKIIKTYSQNGIRDILKFNNKVILGTADGLKQFEKDSIYPVFINKNSSNKPVTGIFQANKKEVVICTDGFGAYITDLMSIKLLDQSKYIAVQDAYAIDDAIWLATNKGIWHYKKEADDYHLFRKYTTQDGLNTNIVNGVVIQNSKIISCSNTGICIIPVNQTKKNSLQNLYFENVQYDTIQLKNNDKFYYSSNSNFECRISSIDFSGNVNNLSYQYKLLPIQKRWIETNSHSLNFSNLKPNSYQLVIQSEAIVKSINFTISPLWWQTKFFKIGSRLLFLLLLVLGIYKIRKRELYKKIKKLILKNKWQNMNYMRFVHI